MAPRGCIIPSLPAPVGQVDAPVGGGVGQGVEVVLHDLLLGVDGVGQRDERLGQLERKIFISTRKIFGADLGQAGLEGLGGGRLLGEGSRHAGRLLARS